MAIRIHSPEGTVGEPPLALTPAPAALAGCRIAVLDNGKPGADVLIGHLARRLAERTGAEVVGMHRKGSAATPCEDALLDEIAKEAELILTGTAD